MEEPSPPAAPAPSPLSLSSSSRCVLNVGGTRFETTWDTLTRRSAYFASLRSFQAHSIAGQQHSGGSSISSSGAPEAVFVDRDPALFAHILQFMRTGTLPLGADASGVRLASALETEARFFGVDLGLSRLSVESSAAAAALGGNLSFADTLLDTPQGRLDARVQPLRFDGFYGILLDEYSSIRFCRFLPGGRGFQLMLHTVELSEFYWKREGLLVSCRFPRAEPGQAGSRPQAQPRGGTERNQKAKQALGALPADRSWRTHSFLLLRTKGVCPDFFPFGFELGLEYRSKNAGARGLNVNWESPPFGLRGVVQTLVFDDTRAYVKFDQGFLKCAPHTPCTVGLPVAAKSEWWGGSSSGSFSTAGLSASSSGGLVAPEYSDPQDASGVSEDEEPAGDMPAYAFGLGNMPLATQPSDQLSASGSLQVGDSAANTPTLRNIRPASPAETAPSVPGKRKEPRLVVVGATRVLFARIDQDDDDDDGVEVDEGSASEISSTRWHLFVPAPPVPPGQHP